MNNTDETVLDSSKYAGTKIRIETVVARAMHYDDPTNPTMDFDNLVLNGLVLLEKNGNGEMIRLKSRLIPIAQYATSDKPRIDAELEMLREMFRRIEERMSLEKYTLNQIEKT